MPSCHKMPTCCSGKLYHYQICPQPSRCLLGSPRKGELGLRGKEESDEFFLNKVVPAVFFSHLGLPPVQSVSYAEGPSWDLKAGPAGPDWLSHTCLQLVIKAWGQPCLNHRSKSGKSQAPPKYKRKFYVQDLLPSDPVQSPACP